MKFLKTTLFVVSLLILYSCGGQEKRKEQPEKSKKNMFKIIIADAETVPAKAKVDEDAADDPAIWYNEKMPKKSLIFGTNKTGGLDVYTLSGERLNYYDAGRLNNVDVRYGFPLENDTVDIVAASNRTTNTIDIWAIHPETFELRPLNDTVIKSELEEVYGFALYKSPETQQFFAFVNSKNGNIEQWKLNSEGKGIGAKKIRTLKAAAQVEGMVGDDELGFIYVAEETGSIKKYKADPGSSDKPFTIAKTDTTNPAIEYDVEGITMYYTNNGKGYLLASSQGNNSFAVYERQGDNKYLGSFRVQDSLVDATEETDGIDVLNLKLNDNYPQGIFIVQDGFNYKQDEKNPQNFKLISWPRVAGAFENQLTIDPGYEVKRRY